jgi:fucose 4-O-acetylase-like acetyltransferase
LDWARGVAAAIMLQGHVFDSLSVGPQRETGTFVLSQFVGGMPPAIFLFLTGVTLAFLMESQSRQQLSGWSRLAGVFSRARYLLLLAVLFRIQLWLFAQPYSNVMDLLKVDVLNVMGASILLLSPLALLGQMERLRWSLFAGLAIAAAAPLVTYAPISDWPVLIQHYLIPDPGRFSLFPWSAYLAFGVTAGTVIKMASSRDLGRVAQWSAIGGMLLIFASQTLASIPYSLYERSEFWLNSPWLVFIKLGITLILLSIAYVWTTHVATGWSWLRVLGSNSLLVYWVHTELVYGRAMWGLRGTLNTQQLVWMAVTVIVAMVATASLASNAASVRRWLSGDARPLQAVPAEGD